ncbi:transporter substrate-binding domain-containing protein [Traorella massiliensis]|nr:transporter substrate-binding domain-containing protein [Traorella massiliensis]
MRNHPEEPVKIVALTETTSSSLIPVRKGEQNLLEAINQALEEMRQSGELKAISEKYFGMDVTSNEVR